MRYYVAFLRKIATITKGRIDRLRSMIMQLQKESVVWIVIGVLLLVYMLSRPSRGYDRDALQEEKMLQYESMMP